MENDYLAESLRTGENSIKAFDKKKIDLEKTNAPKEI